MGIDSIQAAIRRLYAYLPTSSMRENYTLDRMTRLVGHLGDPQEVPRVVHLAGTSGKTSTAYFIAGLLAQTSKRVGLTVSPHVVSITERFQIGGRSLTDERFCALLEPFLSKVEASQLEPTYFEVLVAFAYWYFAQEKVDYAVVETGVGGLLDGTNVVRRSDKVCVITDLGLDHTEILGGALTEIARQKAGIIHAGNHAIVQEQDASLIEVIRDRADTVGATMEISIPASDRSDLPPFQRRNWSLAKAVYRYICRSDELPPLSADESLGPRHIQPPGRMEVVELDGKTVLLDGAHSPQKLAALRVALSARRVGTLPVLASLVRSPRGKLEESMREICLIASHLILTSFSVVQELAKESPSSNELADLAASSRCSPVETHEDVMNALDSLMLRAEETVLVTGSLYLVALVRSELASRNAVFTDGPKRESDEDAPPAPGSR